MLRMTPPMKTAGTRPRPTIQRQLRRVMHPSSSPVKGEEPSTDAMKPRESAANLAANPQEGKIFLLHGLPCLTSGQPRGPGTIWPLRVEA
jgi:hypothetical protein